MYQHEIFHVVMQFSHNVSRRGNTGKEDALEKSARPSKFCLENLSPCWQNGTKISAGHTNPGLKVNRSINFPCLKMVFITFNLCSLRLLKLKTEGQAEI